MLTVTHRNTLLPVNAPGAVRVIKYRHLQQGEPALNCNLHMTAVEADMFYQVQRNYGQELKDIVAGRESTYAITAD